MRDVLDAIASIGIDRAKVIKTVAKQQLEAVSTFELPPPLEDQNIPFVWHDPFMDGRYPDQFEWLQVTRGLSRESIEQRRIGYDGHRYTFPIRYQGKWRNVRRYLPGAADKKWLQLAGHGAALLYPTEVLAGNTLPVLLCEGELDSILANQKSDGLFVAITGTGGAKAPPKDLTPLAGREVFIAYDLDNPGRAGAKKVLPLLAAAGAVARIVDLADVGLSGKPGEKPDITDFFKLGGNAEILHNEMVRLRKAVPEEFAKNSVVGESGSSGNAGKSSGSSSLLLRRASDMTSRRQEFLWTPRIPLGTVSLFAGRGGVGKSTFAIWLAVEAQHGRLPGELEGQPIGVLYVSVEDHWETQMLPRLTAAGADLDRIWQVAAVSSAIDDSTGERIPSLPEDTHLIREAILETGAKLVIIDPITSTISGDDHKRDVVRAVLDPLAQVAAETGAVILGIMHFNKGIGNASDKLSGSHAYRDAARSVMLFARDEDESQVVMSQDKGNYAEASEMSLAYRLVDTAVALDDGNIAKVARVEIIGDTATSVNQIINRPQGQDSDVVQWLNEFMVEVNGRVAATTGGATGKAEGFSKSAISRAFRKTRPRVISRKLPGAMNAPWEWIYEETAHAEDFPEKPEEPEVLNGEILPGSSEEPSTTETKSGEVEK
jgi:hypothetical protein